MSEEYGSAGLVRKTEAPERAVKGSNPKKARYTGLSIDSLRENIARGRIDSKIEKYNREFEKLKELASEVNQGRKDIEGKDGEELGSTYSDVMVNIERYNAQAKKLAKLGVQILAFDEDIQKITLAGNSAAKAIRVPGFLIGPLRMLTKAGREKARLEKEAKAEKKVLEEQMFDAIVNTAQEAIGQEVEGNIDVAKFDSISTIGDAKDVALGAISSEGEVAPPTVDVEDTEVVAPPTVEGTVEKVVINDELFKEAKAKWEKGIHNVLSELVNTRLQEVNSAATEIEGLEKLGRYTNSDRFYVKKAGDDMLVGYVHGNQRPDSITKDVFAEALGIENEEEQTRLFNSFMDLCLMRDAWEKAASKGDIAKTIPEKREVVDGVEVVTPEIKPLPGALHGEEGIYDEDRVVVFNYVISSVRDGKSQEEIVAGIPDAFDEEQRKVVESFVSNYEVLTKGVAALDEFVAAKTATLVEEPVEKTEETGMFAFLKTNFGQYGVGKGKLKGAEIDVLYIKGEKGEAKEVVNPAKFAEIFNVGPEMSREDILNLYGAFTKTVKFANVWAEVANKRVDETIYEGTIENEYKESAYDYDRKPVFDFIVNSVRSGMSAEEIIEKAKETEIFNENHIEIVTTMVTDHYDLVKDAASIYYGDKPIKKEDADLVDMEKAAVKEVIAELVEKKYGKPKKATEDEDENVVTGGETGDDEFVDEEVVGGGSTGSDDEVVDEEIAVDEDSYVAKIGKLVNEISELARHRDALEAALGSEEAQRQLDALNNLINEKLAQIDELTNNNVVGLARNDDEDEKNNTTGVGTATGSEGEVVDEEEVLDTDDEFAQVLDEEAGLSNEELDELFEGYEFVDGVHNFRVHVENFDDAQRYVCAVGQLLFDHERSNIQIEVGPRVLVEEEEVLDTDDEFAQVLDEAAGTGAAVVDADEDEVVVAGGATGVDTVVEDEVLDTDDEFAQVLDEAAGTGTTVVDADENEVVVAGGATRVDTVVEDEVLDTDDEFAHVLDEAANEGIGMDAVVEEEEDLEHKDAIQWWTEMAPILDDPDQALLSRVHIAEIERERAAEAAHRAVEARNFEERRAELIAADKERRVALEADPERRERRARAILDANGLEDTDTSFLEEVRALNPELYEKLCETYRDVKRNELRELSANLANENSAGSAKK